MGLSMSSMWGGTIIDHAIRDNFKLPNDSVEVPKTEQNGGRSDGREILSTWPEN